MRVLLATAGLLVLAGSALAGRPTSHTLRKSPSGPIAAVAADNNLAAWLASGDHPCNEVHVMSPGKRDRILPPPSSSNTTCTWDLSEGQAQLAIAARMSSAIWTLHGTGPSPFDFVLAASFGGPERQLDRLGHATDGTGEWLGGVAGAGHVLAYSWVDVEYVNPESCLAGGMCKEKIADGGIRVVTRQGTKFTSTPLPGTEPALQLAAAAGRVAYIPATIVHGNRPAATTNATLPIVDATTGQVLAEPKVHGIPQAIALSSHVLAVLTGPGDHDRISWFSATDGTKLGSALVSPSTAPLLAASDRMIVYRAGRRLRSVSTRNGRIRTVANTGLTSVGLALARGRLIWAENHNGSGRLRAVTIG
ncbi:MAG TPA: hypothetical protein VJ716_01025 [Gaiellaceae bacterium]|nr:hypothetical protein [Gaiellaceae bacterium]